MHACHTGRAIVCALFILVTLIVACGEASTSTKKSTKPSNKASLKTSAKAVDEKTEHNWPALRGGDRLGTASDAGLPLAWSDEENLRWRRKMPGPGSSSPIVWSDRIYVTCYSGYGLTKASPGNPQNLVRHLVCVDRATGKIKWKKDLPSKSHVDPYQNFHTMHGYASSTPVADASGVYVFFGTGGVLAFSHDGELRWQRSVGKNTHSWGTSSSPVLFKDKVIVHADIEGDGLVALKKEDGEQAWKVSTGNGDSWSTPCLAEIDGKYELIFHHSQGDPNATLMAVNPDDGSKRWECKVLKNYLAPSPIVIDGVCFVIAYNRSAAIRLGGKGDVTDSHVVWTGTRGSEICTPLFHDGHLYWSHQESGVAYCLNAKTGQVVYQERLQPSPGKMYASGVLADGRIYYTSRENGTYIVEASPKFRQLAHNKIESDTSVFNGTPAISEGRLILRSRTHLYCIEDK